MRVLFCSTWGYGHVFPMVPLAQACLDAGHDVLWVSNESARPLVEAAGRVADVPGCGTTVRGASAGAGSGAATIPTAAGRAGRCAMAAPWA